MKTNLFVVILFFINSIDSRADCVNWSKAASITINGATWFNYSSNNGGNTNYSPNPNIKIQGCCGSALAIGGATVCGEESAASSDIAVIKNSAKCKTIFITNGVGVFLQVYKPKQNGSVTLRVKATGQCNGEIVAEQEATIDVEGIKEECEDDEDDENDSGCPSCQRNGPSSPGTAHGFVDSLNFQLNLGAASIFDDAGIISLRADAPSPALSTPALLLLPYSRPGVEALTNAGGILQQIKTPSTLVNIVTNSQYKYSIQFFTTNSLSGYKTNGLYGTNAAAYVTWVMQNPDTSSATNRFWITEQRTGVSDRHFKYSYTNTATYEDRWDLLQPDGVTTISRWRQTNPTNSLMTNLFYQITSGGEVLKSISKVIESVPLVAGVPEEGYLVRYVTNGAGNAIKVTRYTYYATNAPAGSANRVKRKDYSDGKWVYYIYDDLGRITREYSTYLNYAPPINVDTEPDPLTDHCQQTDYDFSLPSTPFTPYQTMVSVPVDTDSGWALQAISDKYSYSYATFHRDDQIASTPGAGYGGAGNLATVTLHYISVGDTNSDGKIKSIARPDGTASVFSYVLTGTNFTTIENSGQPDSWYSPSSIINGREITTVVDGLGRTKSRTEKRIEDGTVGLTMTQVSYVYSAADPFGRDYYVYDLARRTNFFEFACCGLSSQTDPDQVSKVYQYDAMRNITGEVTARGAAFITISNSFDGLGRTLVTRRIGEDSSSMVLNQQKYNALGRVIYQTNALNGVSSNVFVVVNNQVCITNVFPDGGTSIEVYYRDGRLQRVSGTAVSPVSYNYGMELVDGYWREYTLETRLTATGGTNEWTKTIKDGAGRVLKTVYPSSSGEVAEQTYYDQTVPGGQMVRQVDADGVTTLFAYNGERERTVRAIDVNQDGYIDYAGTDRITLTTNEVVAAHGTDVLRQNTYVWSIDNADTLQLISSTDQTPDGLHTWNIVWNNGVAVTSEQHMKYNNSYCLVTNIAPDGSYAVVTNQYGRAISQTQRAANGAQVGQVAFNYDTHGRQKVITDARTGSTTNWYNNADQISSTKTPAPAAGQSAQVTTNLFDTMGRIWKTTLPDGTSVTNKYNLTGMLTNTSGSRTYPVAYTYDHAGRMKTMTTWQNYAGSSGSATTTWNYDIYRGWLTNKTYDGGATGPIYSNTPAGRLAKRIWARTVSGSPLVTTYSYNNAGDLSAIDYSDSTPDVSYSYDRLGRQTSVAQSGGTTTALKYDGIGNLISEAYTSGPLNGLRLTNRYDSLFRRTNVAVINSGGTTLTAMAYGYDNASRLALVTSGSEKVAYSYLANSPLVEKVWFTNNTTLRMTTTKSYDLVNRLTSISSAAGGSNVAVFNYANNSANQRTAVTNVDSSRWVYEYDSLGQVISGKKYWSDGTPVAGQQFEYGFDDIGNRKSTLSGGDTVGANLRYAGYTNNSLNQITGRSVPGYMNVTGTASNTAIVTLWGDNGAYSATTRKGDYFRGELAATNASAALWLSITNLAVLNNGSNPDILTNTVGKAFIAQTPELFYYDLDGNLTNDGRWTYTWDAENRLTKIESLSGAPTASKYKLEFLYDAKGRRLQKLVSTNNGSTYVAQYTNRFAYDGWNMIATLNPQSALLQSFTWGSDLSGGLQGAGGVGGLLLNRDARTTTTNYYVYDGNGNAAVLVNASNGAVTAQYEYGPFGEVLRATGLQGSANPFRFSTKYQDAETDMLYYGYRYYIPNTGRWLSRDPGEEEGGINLYAFIDNQSNDYIDFLGLEKRVGSITLGPYSLRPKNERKRSPVERDIYLKMGKDTMDIEFEYEAECIDGTLIFHGVKITSYNVRWVPDTWGIPFPDKVSKYLAGEFGFRPKMHLDWVIVQHKRGQIGRLTLDFKAVGYTKITAKLPISIPGGPKLPGIDFESERELKDHASRATFKDQFLCPCGVTY